MNDSEGNNNQGSEPELDPQKNRTQNRAQNRAQDRAQEQEIVDLLNGLSKPTIPVEVSERVSHAIAAEASRRDSVNSGDSTNETATDSSTASARSSSGQGGSVHQLDARRRGANRSSRTSSSKVLGAIAGIAAVGVLGVVGFNALGGDNSQNIGNVPSAGPSHPGPLSGTPVIATGTTYQKSTLKAQVEQQLPRWKAVSQQVEQHPELIGDVNLDGHVDSTEEPSSRQLVESANELRQRLPQCLAGIGQEGAKPLIVDMANFQESPNEATKPVAVVTVPKSPNSSQSPADYNGPYEVYVFGANCDRSNPDLMASVTVDSPS